VQYFEAGHAEQLSDAFRSVKSPAAGRLEISDIRCAGLVFRITAKGAQSWSYRYRSAGRLMRATIGKYPAIGLGAARSAADDTRKEVAGGGNPATRKRAGRSADKTFAALAIRYLVEHSQRHKRSHARDDRHYLCSRRNGVEHGPERAAHALRRQSRASGAVGCTGERQGRERRKGSETEIIGTGGARRRP
jgi:hypothetical protein